MGINYSLLLIFAFVVGFYLRGFMPDDRLNMFDGCNQIARLHQDYLMRELDIDPGFDTNLDNPNRDINQKASDLNAKLLEICNTDPRI